MLLYTKKLNLSQAFVDIAKSFLHAPAEKFWHVTCVGYKEKTFNPTYSEDGDGNRIRSFLTEKQKIKCGYLFIINRVGENYRQDQVFHPILLSIRRFSR